MAAIATRSLPLRASLAHFPIREAPPRIRPSTQLRARKPRNPISSPLSFGPSTKRAFGVSAALEEKKYTKDHEWLELSPDGKTGTIGITHYASHNLGDVIFVELPTPPLSVIAGDSIGAVESVKSASDIMTPVSGTVVEVNELLGEKPGTINRGPEGEGWVAKIELGEEGGGEWEGLMGEGEYKAFTGEEGGEV